MTNVTRVRNDRSGFNANQARGMAEYAAINRQYKKWESVIRKAARQGKSRIVTVQHIPGEVIGLLKEAGFHIVDTTRVIETASNGATLSQIETKIMW